ncbi:MAG: hypothetical protein ACRDYF_16490, partial [Acidimicrobiia bacterium]
IATALLTPRIVGVEFPFGHPFGMPGDRAMQRTVLETALTVLSGAGAFGTRVDVDIEWPVPRAAAYRSWQPKEASPIVAMMLASMQSEKPGG